MRNNVFDHFDSHYNIMCHLCTICTLDFRFDAVTSVPWSFLDYNAFLVCNACVANSDPFKYPFHCSDNQDRLMVLKGKIIGLTAADLRLLPDSTDPPRNVRTSKRSARRRAAARLCGLSRPFACLRSSGSSRHLK
jgi:hypothetical protein